MTINLISESQYKKLLEIQANQPKLTFQNVGYEYVDKSKFDISDIEAFNTVTSILRDCIKGFSKFHNFKLSKDNEVLIRFDYNYSADTEGITFNGVGYLHVSELLEGFKTIQK